jgi:hypothetical protein
LAGWLAGWLEAYSSSMRGLTILQQLLDVECSCSVVVFWIISSMLLLLLLLLA